MQGGRSARHGRAALFSVGGVYHTMLLYTCREGVLQDMAELHYTVLEVSTIRFALHMQGGRLQDMAKLPCLVLEVSNHTICSTHAGRAFCKTWQSCTIQC